MPLVKGKPKKGPKKVPKCNFCSKKGYVEDKCWKKNPSLKEKRLPISKQENIGSEDQELALTTWAAVSELEETPELLPRSTSTLLSDSPPVLQANTEIIRYTANDPTI